VQIASRRVPATPMRDLEETQLRVTANGRNGPLPGTIACGALSVYFLVEAFEPFSLFRLFLGVATAVFGIRMSQRWTLVAGKGHIRWHTVLRTRTWLYAEVDHFEVGLRFEESTGNALRVLRMHLADGTAQWMRGLAEPTRGDSVSNIRDSRLLPQRLSSVRRLPLEQIAMQLNEIVTDTRTLGAVRQAG